MKRIVLVVLVAAAVAAAAQAAGQPKTVGAGGRVVGISVDGGVVAAKITVRKGAKVCASAMAWSTAGTRVVTFGKARCATQDDREDNVSGLTIAGSRVVWADYAFGNEGYCTGMFTATLAAPTPRDLGNCDGTNGNVFYDLAGSGGLLVAREYTQCDADCAPDYSGTYQTAITLYQVTGTLARIGPLKRDTYLRDVDAGRLLLTRGATLEVVTPNRGTEAVFITAAKAVGRAYLSGNDVLAVSGRTLNRYDATTGDATLTRTLPAGATVSDFAGGVVLYVAKRAIHVLRLADGRDRTVADVPGLVAARLDGAGLFYGYNDAAQGRLAFLPLAAVTRLLGG